MKGEPGSYAGKGMDSLMERAANRLLDAHLAVALTGAGISVESHIPDFRSAGGLWSRFNPDEYATIEAFRADPERVWNMFRELDAIIARAKPNRAHLGLGELERMGCLHYVITQNVDNLHQAGGSGNVIEYHGNSSTLSCLWCGTTYPVAEKREEYVPRCRCGKVLKPDVILFGEIIPEEALELSFELASSADTLMVVGTSAVVSPVNTIPSIAKHNGATVIEINTERTHLSNTVTDIFLQGGAGAVVSELVSVVKRKRGTAG